MAVYSSGEQDFSGLLVLFGLVCVRYPGTTDLNLTTRPCRVEKSESICAQGTRVVRIAEVHFSSCIEAWTGLECLLITSTFLHHTF